MARLGVPIVDKGVFATTLLVVIAGKARPLPIMQLAHRALQAEALNALAFDDDDPKAPVFFFDIQLPDLTVTVADRALPLRATIFGLHGLAHAQLASIAAQAHAFVVVTDADDDPSTAAATLATKLPEAARDHVYAIRAADSAGLREGLLALFADVAARAA